MHSVLRNAGRLASAVKQNNGLHQIALLSTAAEGQFKTLNVTVPSPFVYHVELNRPKNLNAMNKTMWLEFGECFTDLAENPDCRVIVLSGAGRIFGAGIDLMDFAQMNTQLEEQSDIARKSKFIATSLKKYQDSLSSVEKCSKPVISAIHSACVGGAVNMITAADIRLCTEDAFFQVKEVDIGMAADVGVLQRLPRIIGSESLARELSFTARKLMAPEAKECGLVSKVYQDKESMMKGALEMAQDIASKSPLAVQGTKMNMVYSKDHTIQEGLDHIRNWNMTMLQSEDFINAGMAAATKSPQPTFAKY